MSTVREAIEKRSSTRGFTEEKLTAEELETILTAALQAPTAANHKELHFTVVEGTNPLLTEIEEEKNRLRGITDAPHNFYYEAPILIVISGEQGFRWTSLDAGIAVQNICLRAEELGLGSLIIGSIYDALRGEKKGYFEKYLQLPENHSYEIAVALGHKAVTKEPHDFIREEQVTVL